MLENLWHWLLTSHPGRILCAYALTFPIGWIKERESHGVGVRTIPIVAMAACGYLLISRTGSQDAFSRVLQGLIAGIGFIGGGAIMKEGTTVHGASTAASVWNTGVIGAAVAMENWDVAMMLSACNIVTLLFVRPLKKKLDTEEPKQV